MAIGTNALIDFFGTQEVVTAGGGTSAVADAAFSVTADAIEWDNADDAPEAGAVLIAQWATATSIAGKSINLYGRLQDIQSTNNATVPSATNRVVYLGTFIAPASTATTNFYMPLSAGRMALPNQYTSQVIEFYIENLTGQTITAGWTLRVTPITQGPHA